MDIKSQHVVSCLKAYVVLKSYVHLPPFFMPRVNALTYCFFLVGPSAKASGTRILLNCGPASSARTPDTSCPEYIVRYLLTRFIHALKGMLFLFGWMCNFTCVLITKTYHSYLISHTSVCHFLHHHCHHPLLLLSSTPISKLIFFTYPFLHSSSTFPPTGLTPRPPAVFHFSWACRF